MLPIKYILLSLLVLALMFIISFYHKIIQNLDKGGLHFRAKEDVHKEKRNKHIAHRNKTILASFTLLFMVILLFSDNISNTITGLATINYAHFRADLEITTVLIIMLIVGLRFMVHEVKVFKNQTNTKIR